MNQKNTDEIILILKRLVKKHTEPNIKYLISKIKVSFDNESKFVVKINIDKYKQIPVFLKFNEYTSVFVRHHGETVPASSSDIRDLILNSECVSYDEPFTEEVFNKEDFTNLFKYYKDVNKKELTENELMTIGFIFK